MKNMTLKAVGLHRQDQGSSVKKDNDFKKAINIGREYTRVTIEQIEEDTKLLAQHNIMDYSLLVGIINPNNTSQSLSAGSILMEEIQPDLNPINTSAEELPINIELPSFTKAYKSGDGTCIFVMGIIDILQCYNWGKKVERFLKVYFKCNDKDGLSAMDPDNYRKRFCSKMKHIIT